jgi:hypothetical protein
MLSQHGKALLFGLDRHNFRSFQHHLPTALKSDRTDASRAIGQTLMRHEASKSRSTIDVYCTDTQWAPSSGGGVVGCGLDNSSALR